MVVVRRDCFCFFFQAEDGIRYLVRSRGLGDVYKRQALSNVEITFGTKFLGISCNSVLTKIPESSPKVFTLSLIHI